MSNWSTKNDDEAKTGQISWQKMMGIPRLLKLVDKKWWGPKTPQISWQKNDEDLNICQTSRQKMTGISRLAKLVDKKWWGAKTSQVGL